MGLRSCGDIACLKKKDDMLREALKVLSACNSHGICQATLEEEDPHYVSRKKFSEWVFQGLRRPIHARESFASKSLSNKRTELLLRGVERSILADVRKSGK